MINKMQVLTTASFVAQLDEYHFDLSMCNLPSKARDVLKSGAFNLKPSENKDHVRSANFRLEDDLKTEQYAEQLKHVQVHFKENYRCITKAPFTVAGKRNVT